MFAPVRIVFVALLLGLAGCRALDLNPGEVTWNADQRGRLPLRISGETIEPPLTLVWLYNAGAGFGEGSPMILGETVIVYTRKGEVHAVELTTGRRRGMKSFGDVLEGAPVVYKNTLVVPVGWGRRSLVAYDLLQGVAQWTRKGAPVKAGLLPMGDTFMAVDTESTLRRHAVDDGDILWELPLGREHLVHTMPVRVRDNIIVADDRGLVVAVDWENGARRWEAFLGSPVYASLAADDSTVYVPTTRGRLYALDAQTGAERWKLTLPDTTVRFTRPARDGDLLVLGGTDGVLRALSPASGKERWTFRSADALAAAPFLTPRTIYVGSMGGMLYGVDRNLGALRWEEKLRGRVKSALAAKDGSLVVLAEPRYVYLFASSTAEPDA